MRAIKAYAIVNKKKPKISTLFIYPNKKDVLLYKGEKWVKVVIKPE